MPNGHPHFVPEVLHCIFQNLWIWYRIIDQNRWVLDRKKCTWLSKVFPVFGSTIVIKMVHVFFTWGRLTRFLCWRLAWLAGYTSSRGLLHLWHGALKLLQLAVRGTGLWQPLDAELLSCCQEVLEVLLVHIHLSMIHEVQNSNHVRKSNSDNRGH